MKSNLINDYFSCHGYNAFRPGLSRDEASMIIKKNMKYQIVVDYDIYCSDPESAKKIIDAAWKKQHW
ncbi:MAG: hypothetical protein ABI863_17225 [Ginsengibacter sp.]